VSTAGGYRIPFNRVVPLGDEMRYVAEAAVSGRLAGDGAFARRSAALLERLVGGGTRALLTPSCTHALELAALLLGVGPGDEVVLPSFTFTSVANAFALYGARPVFVDVRPDTLNLDETALERSITPRTRAVVPVHYAGVGCEMDPILELAAAHGLAVVEDNAHGLLGSYRGRALGSLGRLATLSFHETKYFTCGEGGAILVNDPELVERAEILREKGTDRSRFFRGEVDKYTWRDVGSSWVTSELAAAFLLGQLEAHEAVRARRRHLWERYAEALAGWAERIGARLPVVPGHCEPAHHLFHLLMPSGDDRARLIAHLGGRGILAVFHYLPLHLSPMGRRFGGRPGDLPVTEEASERLVRLPLYNGLSDAEQDEVIAAALAFTG
jgi:dTDP-4-amino-4,6-dideoxygalactose transaminase